MKILYALAMVFVITKLAELCTWRSYFRSYFNLTDLLSFIQFTKHSHSMSIMVIFKDSLSGLNKQLEFPH